MKNIWIINHYAMPPQYEVRIRNNVMAKYLQELGYTVKIFSASTIHNKNINLIKDKKTLFIEKSYEGLNFVHIRTSNYKGNGLSRIINMLEFPLQLFRTVKKIADHPDAIICNLTTVFAVIPYWIAKYFKCKFILEVRDLWPESIVVYMGLSKKNPIIWLLYKLEKWIYRKADKIIFTMEGAKDYIIDKGWDKDIDMSKIYYINNGVDLSTFNYNKENYRVVDEDLENSETFKVIYAGSIRLANNVKKIVDTAQIIKEQGYNDIKFLIYGEGSDKSYLEEFCTANNIGNAIFKGYVEKNKIPYILSRSNVNIMHFEQNSLKKYGASLNKLFEYFASGKPTISDCEFGYDIIKNYNCGISIDNADSRQLAEVIVKFYYMSKEKYGRYCDNALKAAKDFDYKILARKLENVIIED